MARALMKALQMFRETASGAKTDRPQLAAAIKALGQGDTLSVTRIDRLARSIRDLLNTLDPAGKVEARFRSLNGAWADTTTAHGRLLLTVTEFERDHIRAAPARTASAPRRAAFTWDARRGL
jgi:DNA invertase Pin-like site-specific DNA recombinase